MWPRDSDCLTRTRFATDDLFGWQSTDDFEISGVSLEDDLTPIFRISFTLT